VHYNGQKKHEVEDDDLSPFNVQFFWISILFFRKSEKKWCYASAPSGHTHYFSQIVSIATVKSPIQPPCSLPPLSGEVLQIWTFLSPFSCKLVCKVLYSTALTVRSHVAISFVMVTHDITRKMRTIEKYRYKYHCLATDFC